MGDHQPVALLEGGEHGISADIDQAEAKIKDHDNDQREHNGVQPVVKRPFRAYRLPMLFNRVAPFHSAHIFS